ncbi:MAG: extracellular solute-binding protein, partial [Anaerolineales bacterium]|nr:extracellular solute-binding protein [Anaerolineales bacterium]
MNTGSKKPTSQRKQEVEHSSRNDYQRIHPIIEWSLRSKKMKLNKGMARILVLGLLFGVLLTACRAAETPEPEGPVSITYWHTMSDAETEQLENVVAAFEAANPGITVETTRYAYDDFKPALLTSIAGGEAPDTARLDIAWVSEFADQGALMQLDGVMPGFEDIIAGTFPGPLSTNYWQGHYYGLPQNTNTQVLLWNSEVFSASGVAAPPSTLAEFAQVACDLTQGEEQYGYALGGTYFWAPAPVFYAMGGAVVDAGITTATG